MVVLGSLLVFNIAITGGLSAHTEQQPFSENLGIIAKYDFKLHDFKNCFKRSVLASFYLRNIRE